jgi:hypothetical protein
MNHARISPVVRDQLINQIIHQGKAKRSAIAVDTYSESLSVNGTSFGPCRGRGTKQLNQSQGAGVPKWRARQRPKTRTSQKNQRIQYPPLLCKVPQMNILQGGVTKP